MSARRLTLVAALRGMTSTISIVLGTLQAASRSLACARISSNVGGLSRIGRFDHRVRCAPPTTGSAAVDGYQ
jgi:hypothetical protein